MGSYQKETKNNNILDKWILIRLQDVVNIVTRSLDKYDLYSSTHEIEDFVSKDFSQWYIRRSRGRVDSDFFETTYQVLITVCKLIAPFAPFISDEIYRNLTKEVSVHLSSWPKSKVLAKKNKEILQEMQNVRKNLRKNSFY